MIGLLRHGSEQPLAAIPVFDALSPESSAERFLQPPAGIPHPPIVNMPSKDALVRLNDPKGAPGYVGATTSALRAQLDVGLTFSRLAGNADYDTSRARLLASAQKAHDNARRFLQKARLDPPESSEIAEKFQQLEARIANLSGQPLSIVGDNRRGC